MAAAAGVMLVEGIPLGIKSLVVYACQGRGYLGPPRTLACCRVGAGRVVTRGTVAAVGVGVGMVDCIRFESSPWCTMIARGCRRGMPGFGGRVEGSRWSMHWGTCGVCFDSKHGISWLNISGAATIFLGWRRGGISAFSWLDGCGIGLLHLRALRALRPIARARFFR